MIICHPATPWLSIELRMKGKTSYLDLQVSPCRLCPSLWLPCPEVIQTLILWDQFSSAWSLLLHIFVSFLRGKSLLRWHLLKEIFTDHRKWGPSSSSLRLFSIMSPSWLLAYLVNTLYIWLLSITWHQNEYFIRSWLQAPQYLEETLTHIEGFSVNIFQ